MVYNEFEKKLHTIISGEILRVERSTVIVQLGPQRSDPATRRANPW